MKAQALKERLKVIAKEKGISFNETWKQFLLERFLARLSASKHQEKFVFKGGLLLAQYLTIGRETTDVDFLARKIKLQEAELKKAIEEIVSTKTEDGFTFSWAGSEELTQPHMAYPGIRATLDVGLENMKDKIQLDIGTGDSVEEIENDYKPFLFKGKPIFAGEISLMTYPVEAIFAEKLETIISKGSTNSRMKDYHDVLLMLREDKLIDFKKLKSALSETFKTRGTELKTAIAFDKGDVEALQKFWTAHIRTLKAIKDILKLPDNIQEVIDEINKGLKKLN